MMILPDHVYPVLVKMMNENKVKSLAFRVINTQTLNSKLLGSDFFINLNNLEFK